MRFPQKPRPSRQMARFSSIALIVVLSLTFLSGVVMAGMGRSNDICVDEETFFIGLQPWETSETPINGFCLDRDLDFPGETLQINGETPLSVQVVIEGFVDRGYRIEDIWPTQLAIWSLMDGLRPVTRFQAEVDRIIADAIANSGRQDCQPINALTLSEAVEAGVVSAIVEDYQLAYPAIHNFYGVGTLSVTNLTGRVQNIVMPYGVRAIDEITNQTVQDATIFPAENAEPGIPQAPLPPTGVPLAPEVLIGGIACCAAMGLSFFRRRQRGGQV